MRTATFLQQLALCAVTATTASCIIPEKCIWVNVVGTVWEATVYGTARKEQSNQTSITGRYETCQETEQHELLQAEDANNPHYVALRQVMVSGASLDCTQNALKEGYTDIECNPFAQMNPAVVVLTPKGGCPVAAKTLVKGTLAQCISPDDTICAVDPDAPSANEGMPTTSN